MGRVAGGIDVEGGRYERDGEGGRWEHWTK